MTPELDIQEWCHGYLAKAKADLHLLIGQCMFLLSAYDIMQGGVEPKLIHTVSTVNESMLQSIEPSLKHITESRAWSCCTAC